MRLMAILLTAVLTSTLCIPVQAKDDPLTPFLERAKKDKKLVVVVITKIG